MVLYDINSAEGATGKKIFDDFLILISLICFQNVHFLLRVFQRNTDAAMIQEEKGIYYG